jgi:P4 family phage/plasmid primase-like protien
MQHSKDRAVCKAANGDACPGNSLAPHWDAMESIFADLADQQRWVCWRYEERHGRPTKVPVRPNGAYAKVDDPGTWSPLARCIAYAQATPGVGVGIVFNGDGLVGIDLDGCHDPDTGELEAEAARIVADLASYTEVTPSGRGVHVLCRGTLPGGATGTRRGGIEIYATGRFFTVTGEHVATTPDEIADTQEALERLWAHLGAHSLGRPTNGSGEATSVAYQASPEPDTPWRRLNTAALERLGAWVPALFGDTARFIPGKGGYRIPAAALGRDLEEDLAIMPHGIRDWGLNDLGPDGRDYGREGRRTPLDVVLTFGGVADELAAAEWLADRLGKTLEAFGFLDRPAEKQREAHPSGVAGNSGEVLLDLSHDGLALEMGAQWTDARHVALWARWLFWTGPRWEADERLLHMTRTRDFLRDKANELVWWAKRQVEAGKAKEVVIEAARATGKSLRSAPTVANVVGLARSNPGQAATVEQWDRDPWLLGTPGGTVDLRTGELQPARPETYITKLTRVTPAPPGTPAPLWQAFLERVFRHDPALVPYMQRVAGYALTGLITEHALIFCWGQGGNGKGVFFNTLAYALADYAAVAAPDLLLVTTGDRHPTDMAMLRGARLVIASEVAPGRAWDEPKLKSLTGGDPITARFMRQDFFTFQPQFTLLVAGNHKPGFRSVNEAVRRRVQLVPFLQNIPREERDPNLPEKLKAEAPAILRWAIDGCLAWQKQGLDPPPSVREASDSYLEGEDALGQWLDERCDIGGTVVTPFDTLFQDWQAWCTANGGPGWGGKTFSKALDERGFHRGKSNNIRGFRGITLRPKTQKNTQTWGWEDDL